MSNVDSCRKLVKATPNNELIGRAKIALQKKGIPSKQELAKLAGVSRGIVTKFFNQKPIKLDKFNLICKTLGLLDYEVAILELEEEEEEEDIGEEKIDFTIVATIDKEFIGKLKSVIEVLRQLTDGDIYYSDIGIGSLKLILEGSQSALEKIEELFQSGELNNKIAEQNLDITVENVSFRGTKIFGKPQLAVIIPGNYNQADINTLRSALIDTSANNIFKQIPPGQMLLLLLLFFFLAVPLIVEGIFPIIFQDTPQIENKR